MTKNCEVLYLEDFRHPKVGEFAFCQRYGLRKVLKYLVSAIVGGGAPLKGKEKVLIGHLLESPLKKELESIEDSIK
ncbi:hypothetical protein ACYCSU_16730 [Paenibacillus sp. ALE1]